MRFSTLWTPVLLAVFAVVSSAGVRAEVGRERSEAKPDDARPELDGRRHEGEGLDAFEDRVSREGEKNLREIQKLLDEIQNRLGGQKTGAQTQSRQREALERMTRLIEELDKACQECSGGGGSSSSAKSRGAREKSGGGRQKGSSSGKEEAGRKGGKQRQRQDGVASKQEKSGGAGKEKDRLGPEDNRQRLPNDRTDEEKLADTEAARLRDALRASGRWGFLPPKAREQMLSTSGKEAPAEYRRIIEKYYQRIGDYYEQRARRSRP